MNPIEKLIGKRQRLVPLPPEAISALRGMALTLRVEVVDDKQILAEPAPARNDDKMFVTIDKSSYELLKEIRAACRSQLPERERRSFSMDDAMEKVIGLAFEVLVKDDLDKAEEAGPAGHQ